MRCARSIPLMAAIPVLVGALVLPYQASARGGGARSAVVLVPRSAGAIRAVPGFHRYGSFHRHSWVRSRHSRKLSSIYLRPRYAGRRFLGGIPFYPYVVGAWPYAWTGYADMPVVQVQTIIKPEVIVIRPNPGGGVESKAVTNYSYVAGCHAIANGYHCDTSGKTH